MLRAHILNIENLPDLEAKIDLEGASEDRNYFEVHVRARGEFWPNLLKPLLCITFKCRIVIIIDVLPKESCKMQDETIKGTKHLVRHLKS